MVTENLQTDQIRERFFKINRERIERTRAIMGSKQKDLLQLLPLLFHVNSPLLPGYLEDEVPHGVFAYVPDDGVINQAKGLWRGFDLQRKGSWVADIDALFLMGSCGTVAFNRKSDFDIWLCHRPDLKKKQIQQLQEKAIQIEKWFDSIGLEVHFFLMNAQAFKKGKGSKLSTESSGTAQHTLLLDEFYRTSIWVAGKTPFWWYVPPYQENSYEKLRIQFAQTDVISETEVVDFGPVASIPSGEFFGASVWQIYKGIDSPYKSILKITLLETYADSYPTNTPLSVQFKQRVYGNFVEPESLDPYLMMLDRIESYLRKRNEAERLDVIRRSFYLKLALPLSDAKQSENWRTEYIKNLVNSWQWHPDLIAYLDQQNNWKLEDVARERSSLMMYLTKSYAALSAFAKKNARKRLIKQQDLSVLGRKLYSVFERKPGKIEVFNRGIVDSLAERSITIMLLLGKNKSEHWCLYRDKVVGSQFKNTRPLKQARGLIELVAWTYFNQLINDDTQKLLYAPGSEIGNNELNSILDKFSELCDDGNVLSPKSESLLKPSCVQKSIVFLNLGKGSHNFGPHINKQIISGDIDILNYGTGSDSIIKTIEYCYITSWKEIFVFKYSGPDGLGEWLCDLLTVYHATTIKHGFSGDDLPEIVNFDAQTSYILGKRLMKLFAQALACYVNNDVHEQYFIYEVAKKVYCINWHDNEFRVDKYEGVSELVTRLSKIVGYFKSASFEKGALNTTPLPAIYKENRPSAVQLFYYVEKEGIMLYVLDEMGALFTQKLAHDELRNIVLHQTRFFKTLLEQRELLYTRLVDTEIFIEQLNCEVEHFELFRHGTQYRVKKLDTPELDDAQFYGIKVIGDVIEKKSVFTFYCENDEYSSEEYGSKIFTFVAQQILKKRKTGGKYHIYITSLEISPQMLGHSTSHIVQTGELLKYKKRIEENLNSAIAKL